MDIRKDGISEGSSERAKALLGRRVLSAAIYGFSVHQRFYRYQLYFSRISVFLQRGDDICIWPIVMAFLQLISTSLYMITNTIFVTVRHDFK